MKFNLKNTVFALAFLAFSFSLWSCKDDTEINPDASMSALLDGTPWNASSTGIKSGNTITLVGSSNNGKTISVSFKAELGTQDLSAIDSSGVDLVPVVNYSPTPIPSPSNTLSSATCTSQTGQITITEMDTQAKTISGTFTSKVCTFNNSIEITQGTINKAKYN
ncbi:MAG: hypothetical protein COZ18_00970 [Flexibacter sp. CG_4_10_14_3_um_filter_32_15]|nr:MAG: hypothetical protein COZ18_00970 [Flexibacter sp. CG_4_10_14_3_um_filter_32_15]